MNHTQLLNGLIEKHNLKSYLEIGVRTTAQNFDKILCEDKVGVDPEVTHRQVFKMTSNDYFWITVYRIFDLIFIDGLHHADQVERDFNNSLSCLSNSGFIVIHDCLPVHENTTHVPRDSKQWHGDVYKFVMKLRTIPGIDFITYNFDEGCCVVWKNKLMKGSKKVIDTSWENYKLNGRKLMNVVDETNI